MEKWSDIEIVRFLDLFESRPCLWNADLDEYRSPDKRSEAIRWIIEKMGVRMSEMEIRCKIKNIRTTYVRYLKRMLRAKHLGLGEDYAPTLVWFKRADVFLRTHTERTLLKKEQKKRDLESIRTFNRRNTSTTIKYDHASDSEADVAGVETECEDDEATTMQPHTSDVISHNKEPSNNSVDHHHSEKKSDSMETSESDEATTKQSQVVNDFPLMPRYSRNQPIPCLSQRNFYRRQEGLPREMSNSKLDATGDHRRPRSPDVHRGSSDVHRRGSNVILDSSNVHLDSSDVHRRSSNVHLESSDVHRVRYSSDVHLESSDVHRGKYSSDVHPKRKRSRTSNCADYQDEDGFDIFSKLVGNQLRQLPLERALRCQDDIHSLLMKERIEYCQEQKRNKERVVSSRNEPSSQEVVVETATGQNQVFKEESFSFTMDCMGD